MNHKTKSTILDKCSPADRGRGHDSMTYAERWKRPSQKL